MDTHMNIKTTDVLFCVAFFSPCLCVAEGTVNFTLLPDSVNSFDCHQPGAEFRISKTSTLAVFGRLNCHTDRSTYGETNDDVSNTFGRVFVPWRYAPGGAFKNGPFYQALIGVEKSKFRSISGSRADVTFVDLAAHYGYQWYWRGGFNLSVLGGIAYLVETDSEQAIAPGETNEVIDYLDKNTKTNVHLGAGILLGWLF